MRIEINANQDSEKLIPLFSDPNAAVMEFPANNFYYKDGRMLNGTAVLHLTTWRITDPDDDLDDSDDALLVPGDFSVGGETGDINNGLLSRGIFCMRFTDVLGLPLMVGEGCKFRLTAFEVRNVKLDPPFLWGLDPDTARWQQNSEMFEMENGALEARIQLLQNIRDFNIDWRFETCFVKVKVFRMAGTNVMLPMSGVRVNVVMTIDGISGWVFSSSVITSADGACMRVLCCKSRWCHHIKLQANIKAESNLDGVVLGADPSLGQVIGLTQSQIIDLGYIVESDGSIKTKIQGSIVGPTFQTLSQCLITDQSHFRFYHFRSIVMVEGVVLGSSGEGPLRNVPVLINGTEVARTNDFGIFKVLFTKNETRVVLR